MVALLALCVLGLAYLLHKATSEIKDLHDEMIKLDMRNKQVTGYYVQNSDTGEVFVFTDLQSRDKFLETSQVSNYLIWVVK